jgi:exonuclease III
MRFGTWNIRSLYRSGSLTTAARELARCKLDLVGVQEVRWDKGLKLNGTHEFLVYADDVNLLVPELFF